MPKATAVVKFLGWTLSNRLSNTGEKLFFRLFKQLWEVFSSKKKLQRGNKGIKFERIFFIAKKSSKSKKKIFSTIFGGRDAKRCSSSEVLGQTLRTQTHNIAAK